ncbi:hypothetical protein B0H19DRAFT_1082547 [Mycena capillaripes]|nr:hypothetical protein B0H19DRAFT_1082547 [Mycena capillaripes]
MQYTIDSEKFDFDWNATMSLFSGTGLRAEYRINPTTGIYINLFLLALHALSRRRKFSGAKLLIVASWIMLVLGTAQMAINIALAVLNARLVQQDVRSQVDPQLVRSYHVLEILQDLSFALNKSQLYRCYVIWGSQRKIIILPALFMLSTIDCAVVGIFESTLDSSIAEFRIPYGLAAATNLLLTAFTGKLESGAIYCVAALFLIVTFSLNEVVFVNATSIAHQLINIIPTFTLVYIGLTNTAENPLPDYVMPRVRSGQPPHPGPVQLFKHSQVLDIKPQETEEEDTIGV